MKKEKKEQLNIYLWDLESAVESWISKLKKEQDKLFAMGNRLPSSFYCLLPHGKKRKSNQVKLQILLIIFS